MCFKKKEKIKKILKWFCSGMLFFIISGLLFYFYAPKDDNTELDLNPKSIAQKSSEIFRKQKSSLIQDGKEIAKKYDRVFISEDESFLYFEFLYDINFDILNNESKEGDSIELKEEIEYLGFKCKTLIGYSPIVSTMNIKNTYLKSVIRGVFCPLKESTFSNYNNSSFVINDLENDSKYLFFPLYKGDEEEYEYNGEILKLDSRSYAPDNWECRGVLWKIDPETSSG